MSTSAARLPEDRLEQQIPDAKPLRSFAGIALAIHPSSLRPDIDVDDAIAIGADPSDARCGFRSGDDRAL